MESLWSRPREGAITRLPDPHHRYACFFELNALPALLVDVGRLRILEANRAAGTFFGRSLAALAGQPLHEVTRIAAWRISESTRILLKEATHHFQERIPSGTGERIVAIHASALHLRDGRLNIFLVFQDRTAEAAREAALQAGETRYRTLFEAMRDGIALFDRSIDASGQVRYRFLEANAAFGRLMDPRTTGRPGNLLSRDALDPELVEAFERAAATGKPARWSNRQPSTGRYLEAQVFCPMTGQIAALFTDVTERHESERQRRQTDKMDALGALAGGIAHDSNNLLGAILLAVEILEGQVPREGDILAKLQVIRQAAERSLALNRQILTFSRKSEEKHVPVHLNRLLQEAVQLLNTARPHGVEIHLDLQADLWVDGDPNQLSQVIINLAINAFHAMQPGGGTLSITLGDYKRSAEGERRAPPHVGDGRQAMITVRDTGSGMDEGTLDRLFEPFFTTKAPGEGSGLGLSIVHGIVGRHQGDINVWSRRGHGASFRIYLPATAPADTGTGEEPWNEPRGHERILFVAEEEIQTVLAKLGLQALGYEVTTRSDGRQALEAFRSQGPFDAVVTGLNLPVLNGLDMAMSLRAAYPDLPIVLLTGSPAMGELAAHSHPFDAILTKPVTSKALATSLRSLLDTRTLSRPGRPRPILLAMGSEPSRARLRRWLEAGPHPVLEARTGEEVLRHLVLGGRERLAMVITEPGLPGGEDLSARIRGQAPALPIVLLAHPRERASLEGDPNLDEVLVRPVKAALLRACVTRLAG
jgi:signal transduction histidine kinase/DNA-binding NarL/FixJ family response regulator